MELGNAQHQRFFLHYPQGHRLYVCIVDQQRRAFDLTDNTFKSGNKLASMRDACLFATGTHEERADHHYSYSVEIDLVRLLNGNDPESAPANGAIVTFHWLEQLGEEPDVTVDRRLHHSCGLRQIDGQFEPANKYDADLLDETLAFERREAAHKQYREFILREIDVHDEMRTRLSESVRSGNVSATLRVLTDDLCFWAGNLKQHLLHHVSHFCKDPTFIRMRNVPENAPFRFVETWVVRDWIGSHEAYDLLEFHKSTEYARSFAARLDTLHSAAEEFSEILTKHTVQSEGEIDVEMVVALDEARKELKHKALWLAEHVDVVAAQFDAAKPVSHEQRPPPDHSERLAFLQAAGQSRLPHSLVVAHEALSAALDEAIALYKRTQRFPNPAVVVAAVERFVHELHLEPKWYQELERRVLLVESACGDDSPYSKARTNALLSYTGTPQQLCRGKLAIERLRSNSTDCPCFLAEVIEVRNGTEAVISEPSLGLTPGAIQAFSAWRDACVAVQQEAERLEVDGCSHLYHVYLASKPGSTDRSRFSRAILQTQMGGANLESLKAAASSAVAWIAESPLEPRELLPLDEQQPSPSQSEHSQPNAAGSFNGWEIVFYQDRVEFCGIDICSGRRSRSRRVVLELLSKQLPDGSFVAYSGDELEVSAKEHGAKGTAGRWIDDLRYVIMERLRNQLGRQSKHKDVVLSGGPGYRFAECVSVRFADNAAITVNTDITDTDDSPDVRDDDIRDVFDVRDDAAGARRTWILQELAKGRQLRSPDVKEHFDCSLKTAQRDLTALKDEGKIEFVGAPRTGSYRIRQAPEAS